MNEKLYKSLSRIGAANLVIGICVLTAGLISGVLLIINGSILLKKKEDLTL